MSNAKWCDSCGSIFPEGEDGSESGIGRVTVNTPNGPQTRDQTRDYCSVCVNVRNTAMNRFNPREFQRQELGHGHHRTNAASDRTE